jgi:hypothetical protein
MQVAVEEAQLKVQLHKEATVEVGMQEHLQVQVQVAITVLQEQQIGEAGVVAQVQVT